MALDYLTIPGKYSYFIFFAQTNALLATSVDVEHVFNCGHLILSHVHSQLLAQSTRPLICLGSWSLLGLVKDLDVLAVGVLDEVEGDEEPELEDGWDHIIL
ncbi:hypothetical protein L208DRAFT_1251025 [Tricholoma matsutake]|nr:hypothetical protein L208DRAFT_1251025 [Tricholoma matsutake 945]